MDTPRLNRIPLAFLPGAAVAWAVLLVFHPNTGDDLYVALRDEVTMWLVVHVGTLLCIGVVGVGFYLLMRDVSGPAARVSRLAIGTFVLFYGAGEAVLGIATGVLVQHANTVPAQDRAAAAGAVEALWDDFVTGDLLLGIGAAAWILAVFAAAIAFRRVGAPIAVSVLLALSAIVAFHPFPLGPLGLLFLTGAVLLVARWQRVAVTAGRTPAPAARRPVPGRP